MEGYNVILVYNPQIEKLLMCQRKENPYKGLNNLVGGKIESGEDSFEGAYRELYEETGILRKDITLKHLMDFTYYFENCYLEVYVGKLKRDVVLIEEKNKLVWVNLENNFFDTSIYAGEGNIGHMIKQVNKNKKTIFKN